MHVIWNWLLTVVVSFRSRKNVLYHTFLDDLCHPFRPLFLHFNWTEKLSSVRILVYYTFISFQQAWYKKSFIPPIYIFNKIIISQDSMVQWKFPPPPICILFNVGIISQDSMEQWKFWCYVFKEETAVGSNWSSRNRGSSRDLSVLQPPVYAYRESEYLVPCKLR